MQAVLRQEIHQRINRFRTQLTAHQLDGAFILQTEQSLIQIWTFKRWNNTLQ